MKLKPADIDRLMAENVPKPPRLRSPEDYAKDTAASRDALLESLSSYKSQSTAKQGDTLPPPPKAIPQQGDPTTHGATTTTTTTTTEAGQAAPEATPEAQTLLTSNALPAEVPPEVAIPLVPLAIKGVNLDLVRSRAELVEALTQNLPQNEYSLPKFIYRADLLDWRLFCGNSPEPKDQAESEITEERYKSMQEYLDAATLHLSYAEGFPALPTGEPLWARFPFEDTEHYAAFSAYCVQPGARQTHKLTKWPHDQVLCWYHEEYWGVRIRCYDMMAAIHAAKQRENRIMHCEDDHFLQAENMYNRLKNMISDVDWSMLVDDPKTFVDVMERVVKLQRVSLGLSSMGNVNDKRELRSESIEAVMRKIAEPKALIPTGETEETEAFDVKQILKSPEALASAQELIIRMTRTVTQK